LNSAQQHVEYQLALDMHSSKGTSQPSPQAVEPSAHPEDAASQIALVGRSLLFDAGYYRSCSRLLKEADTELIAHYVREGENRGLQPNPLFDPPYYRSQLSEPSDGLVLLLHYLEEGWRRGLRPHPLFDTAYYCKHNPDVVQAGINPLAHFLASGGYEGRRPHPLFHPWNYRQAVPGLLSSMENPLLHYLRQGWREGFDPHPSFRGNYYLDDNPDVAYSGQNPLVHFVLRGFAEGRLPHPLFSKDALPRGPIDSVHLDDDLLFHAIHLVKRTPAEDHALLRREIRRQRAPRWDAAEGTARIVAFYLPQFHPIPANDRAWGKGFTEWVNVRRGRPNFEGHDQPREPGELGYYDLRDPGVMERQAELASEYGVHGFCFYWYWFKGQKPLAQPLELFLASGRPDFAFCLCWANEGWTRKWSGEEEVIFSHKYTVEDDLAHAVDLARYLRDPRYIRIAGRPLLLIYRAGFLPHSPAYLKRWREMFRRIGVGEIHLAAVESGEFAWAGTDPRPLGFDSAVEFPPHGAGGALPTHPNLTNRQFKGSIFDYRQTVLRYATAAVPAYPRFRGVMCAWDNTARYQDTPVVFVNANPGAYQAWLEAAIRDAQSSWAPDGRFVFINAWNEWGEGTYLEPDQRWGRGYLEATRNASRAA
jgi:hypothetical protein